MRKSGKKKEMRSHVKKQTIGETKLYFLCCLEMINVQGKMSLAHLTCS